MPRPLPHPQQLPGVLQTTGHSRVGLGCGGVDGKVWGNPHFSHGTKLDPGVADPVEICALEVCSDRKLLEQDGGRGEGVGHPY